MTTKKRASKRAGKKASTKRKKKNESVGADGQEPLERFRRKVAEGSEDANEVELTDEDRVGKGVQKRLPGQERKTTKRIEALSLELKDLQDERMRVQKLENEKRDELTSAMEKADIPQYDLPDGYEAVLEDTKKAKVHKKKSE